MPRYWRYGGGAACGRERGPFGARQAALRIALACGVLALPSLGALLLDARQLSSVSVWAKPLKFELSLALHWATVARLLGAPHRAFVTVVELLYIVLQAARGRASHFNNDTLLKAVRCTALMGTVLVALTSWQAVQGKPLWPPASRIP